MNVVIAMTELGVAPEELLTNRDQSEIIEWIGGDPQPSQAELEAAWAAFEARGGFAREEAEKNRKTAYSVEADPLFFQASRGEIEMSVYTDKVAEIKARYPYPV